MGKSANATMQIEKDKKKMATASKVIEKQKIKNMKPIKKWFQQWSEGIKE